MQYFVTIYIHPMDFNIPHAFLGLTHKHPDELDEQGYIDMYKYQVGYYSDKPTLIHVKGKWYEQIYPSIIDSNFQDEGFFGFAPVESAFNHWGKVFENNQYIPKWHDNFQQYTYIDERPSSTFWQQNCCVFEISKEQYEKLLESIKEDVEKTIKRTPSLIQDDSKMTSLETLKENLYYNSSPINKYSYHNCTTWALNKLDSIGIEVYNTKEWIPDAPIGFNVKNTLFTTIQAIHSTFLKFQNIDDNLKSIKGAIAFRDWARKYINHSCLSQVYLEQYNKERGKDSLFLDKEIMQSIFHLGYVYVTLDKILQSRLDKINSKNIKGDFELIYYEQREGQLKILKASNDYKAEPIKEFDLSIPANNCSLNKFYPFIFIPKDEMISRVLYHQYDYGKVSNSYEIAMNEFYTNVIAGIQSDKYWSKSYHKINKHLEKLNV
ncbi:hypothetical protein CQA53_10175 [Helicobacter didelphidarum]|uniref:Uncharacterized protein n=1 Tax=Helicobacter didelphidarum TaxID=2040648 RepID=A0A3D8I8I0_9HELI|nr:hypothetical protein [Helicobacter didelphidarum]RDU61417.1 hypothetical protein CQA53_10175 [Helicobacter didelphidarum]